jgi:hypothetical protein
MLNELRQTMETADAKTRIHRNNKDWSLSLRKRNGYVDWYLEADEDEWVVWGND